ncbi:uncharacterized protein LY89DRAFT_788490 [Mollisia scopiformis]|uniref:Uncharacterized protein n=1 Tax=Mollisia scopiformis TaxID=149040 RepID=A0A132BB65_MOLSC|nr:uncharacterized protein LY89DRAFT_788490 [Mollisia scopiformis]KUJ09084.1 hypothetical protein LY89DRAFT_788490 [Mollisia scopiformis]
MTLGLHPNPIGAALRLQPGLCRFNSSTGECDQLACMRPLLVGTKRQPRGFGRLIRSGGRPADCLSCKITDTTPELTSTTTYKRNSTISATTLDSVIPPNARPPSRQQQVLRSEQHSPCANYQYIPNMEHTTTINSLSKMEAFVLLKKYGPEALLKAVSKNYVGLAQTISGVFTDHNARQTFEEQRKVYEAINKAIPELLKLIESKEIRVVQNAFNSTPAFVSVFQSTALIAIGLAILDLKNAINRVGSALEGIRSELTLGNVEKIQGWGEGDFGWHVHRFVQDEMAAFSDPEEHHFFYVWNPDPDWYPRFEEQNLSTPLGPNFGGYHTDLPTLCLRMSVDRTTLANTTTYGRDAVFHLLCPAFQPVVIEQKIVFHDTLFPLVITGQQHRGFKFVWFFIPTIPDGMTLRYIVVLEDKIPLSVKTGAIGFYGGGLGAFGCAIAATAFPPCAPVALSLGVGLAPFGFGSGAFSFLSTLHLMATTPGSQTLGDPIFFQPDNNE